MTFIELVLKVLEETKTPLNSEEIWEYAKSHNYHTEVGSQGKTPWASIGARIYVSMRDDKNSPFAATSTRPKRFYLKSHGIVEPPNGIENKLETKKVSFLEVELHPFLAYYARNYLKAFTKTIQHTKSNKKEYGEWIHPDMVGCYFPLEDWNPEVVDFSSQIGNIAIKLFSFEIKRELNYGNIREAFFQAVSNSSWANSGYLVSAIILNDDDFLDELRRLSSSFGIGVIKLDIEDPDSSDIIFPAREKELLDWDTINKMTMNPDFTSFVKRIKIDIQSKEIRKEKYDKIIDKEVLVKTIKK